MYVHTKCDNEVCVRSTVYQYAPLQRIYGKKSFELGDVSYSSVEEDVLWCEDCACSVPREEVREDGTNEEV